MLALLFPHHGPVCCWGWGSSGVTRWGRAAPLLSQCPQWQTHTPIHLNWDVRVVGGQSLNLRTQREGKGKSPSNCFWKEVRSVGALSRAVMLAGEGHSTDAAASTPRKANPWPLSSSPKLSARILQTQSPGFVLMGPLQSRTPLLSASSPPPQTLSLSALPALPPGAEEEVAMGT